MTKPLKSIAETEIEEVELEVDFSEQDALEMKEHPILIRPLGHKDGKYHFIAPSGEHRSMSAEQLEAGRGVRAIFVGQRREIIDACLAEFPSGKIDWCPKRAGLWIIEKCNQRGVIDPSSLDLRASGVWRDENGGAIMHCGEQVIFADGRNASLMEFKSKQVMIAGQSISAPDFEPLPFDAMKVLLNKLEKLWGWSRSCDACIWLGFIALASLGGYPTWRPHLYVSGSRGSGKSTLLNAAACLLGDLAGEPINDATEAGLRQSRNNHARPLLIDEFEPDSSDRGAARQDNILGLLRRMSGGAGGKISRGSADHKAVSFRIVGSAYLTSINHVHFEPQDRSRFAVIALKPLPAPDAPSMAAEDVEAFLADCCNLSSRFRGRMLRQSPRWDRTFASIKARAQSKGADVRQAETAAAILCGLDLALHNGEIDSLRLEDLDEPLDALLGDASEAQQDCEGQDALDHLLSEIVPLDRGENRSIREMLERVIDGNSTPDSDHFAAALRRHGVYVSLSKRLVSVRVGKDNQTAKLFARTK
ncbi:hypothetical protein [Aestuariicoccus sp. MJ-SS9]|uniref:hypothetical protein n=1 Tax=Aestuariicoccus sp. MJ-SS9 TaxID=3079855 RepID=UPI002913DFE4|nr:hypothetical protein [Aestuariicoccus sp. MJ-SS9]MDU8913431.1 hypothetical protein [Aestuariicoccus sp. MJ-SS9]